MAVMIPAVAPISLSLDTATVAFVGVSIAKMDNEYITSPMVAIHMHQRSTTG